MSESKTDHIIEVLVEKTSHTRDEITKMIKETIEEMDNMINEEGAAYVVANNLGVMISLDENVETLTTEMLSPGQSNITILGRVKRIYSTRTFDRKDGTTGKVRNIEIIDSEGSVRVALWDSRTEDIDEKDIEIGSLVRISGANARMGYQERIELSLGSQSVIDPITDKDKEKEFPQVSHAPMTELGDLTEKEDGTDVSVKGKIVNKRDEPTTFSRKDGSEGRVSSIRIKDQTGQSRITFWDNHVAKLEQLDTGDIIKATDVNVGSSDYGKELTFRDYSTIKTISDPALDEISAAPSSRETTELDNLSQVEDNMRGITVTGQIISIGKVNTFEKDGETNHVGNITIRDNTQQRRVTLWRDKAKEIDKYSIGDVIKIENASARYNDYSSEVELSVNDYSTVTDITSEANVDEYEQEPEFVKLSEITETRRGVSLKIQINRFFGTNTIDRKDGSQATVMNASVYDSEGNEGRLAAWDENIAKIDQYNDGDALILYNVSVKPSDDEYPPSVTVNQYTKVEETELDDIIPMFQSASNFQNNPMNYQKSTLDSVNVDTKVEVEGTVVSAYSPNFYNSCTQCNRKVEMIEEVDEMGTCPVHGEVQPQVKMILTMVLDDTTDTIRVKLFDKTAEDLLEMTAKEAKEMIERLSDEKAPIKKQQLEMKDFVVKGRVIMDDYSNEKQINVEAITPVDISKKTDDFLNSASL